MHTTCLGVLVLVMWFINLKSTVILTHYFILFALQIQVITSIAILKRLQISMLLQLREKRYRAFENLFWRCFLTLDLRQSTNCRVNTVLSFVSRYIYVGKMPAIHDFYHLPCTSFARNLLYLYLCY